LIRILKKLAKIYSLRILEFNGQQVMILVKVQNYPQKLDFFLKLMQMFQRGNRQLIGRKFLGSLLKR
jgi:hypothetical protein